MFPHPINFYLKWGHNSELIFVGAVVPITFQPALNFSTIVVGHLYMGVCLAASCDPWISSESVLKGQPGLEQEGLRSRCFHSPLAAQATPDHDRLGGRLGPEMHALFLEQIEVSQYKGVS